MVINNYLFIALTAFPLGIFFISISKNFALRHNVLIPQRIPLVGGIGMGLSFVLISLFVFFLKGNLSKEVIGIIIPAVIILVFGVIDDWKELSISAKFLVQIMAVSLLIFFGIRTKIVYIGNLLNLIITFIWVLGITNAFNHLDVIDGLAAGCTIIISSALLVVALLSGDTKIVILSLALAAATLSCFIYNFPPARIYMGNSGSHFLGFTLAAIALVINYAPLERKIALLSPLLILGFPIFDTAFLILMRLKKGISPFKKSDDHIAHRLQAMGFSKRGILLLIYSLSSAFALSGIILSCSYNLFGIILIISVVLFSLFIAYRVAKVQVYG